MRSIAVIGAGAAGLCAARHIAARNDMRVVVYEQSKYVGGTWKYTEETDIDKNGLKIHSSMYKNLKTNLPKEVMAFPDFLFNDDVPSFMSHELVQDYLQSYCDHFGLSEYINFETKVELVEPVDTEAGKKWQIRVKNLKEKSLSTTMFDAVFICNGHYCTPDFPNIPGQDNFKGSITHSHTYRHPEVFKDKKVVLLGAASSGTDIAIDISSHAKSVVMSHRSTPIVSPLPQNVTQADVISKFEEDGETILFKDGSRTKADAVMYCTGYMYDFTFLHPTCNIEVEDRRIKYIYHHVVNPSHPTQFFIGICTTIVPFPQFHYQVLFCLASLDGSMVLPSKDKMLEQIEAEYQRHLSEGLPQRYAHKLASEQWKYNDLLADAAKIPRLPKWVEELYIDVGTTRRLMLCDYKKYKIRRTEKGSYELVNDL